MDSPERLTTSLFHRGAEADLHLSKLGPWKTVVKVRVKKNYRNPELDAQIRRERTVREAVALHEAKRSGVMTPSVLEVCVKDCSLSMTFVEGDLVRDQLDVLPRVSCHNLFLQLGGQIGGLHHNGWVHGDLTTSNVVLSPSGLPFVLDFGMASRSKDPEDRGVDLHLLQRSLATSHATRAKSCMKAMLQGYRNALGSPDAERSVRKQEEIGRRGRYFALR